MQFFDNLAVAYFFGGGGAPGKSAIDDNVDNSSAMRSVPD